MKRVIFAAIFTVLLGVSAGAQAWWGPFGGWGPCSGWGNDWYGNGEFNFSMSFGGWGRGWDYYNPYWGGYYPYGGYSYLAPPPYWAYPYTAQPVAPATAPSATK
jgi:hypothetical protein